MQHSSLQAGFAVVAEVVILFIYLLFLAMINVSLVEVIVNLVH
jgi:hypothetical protein